MEEDLNNAGYIDLKVGKLPTATKIKVESQPRS